jgi:hypothetical protein
LDTHGTDWDRDKLIRLFNQAYVEAIGKIKIPSRHTEDFIAWPLEKSGLFSVRSAYDLGLKFRDLNVGAASSSVPDGERKLWNNVWKGGVPPKVNVFIWKLARNALPTRRRKFTRNMEHGDICLLCGLAPETSYHATVECPQAFNLRQAMRVHWPLPEEGWFQFTGPDWLLLLLDRCTPEQKEVTKLVLWRAWTVHNKITHDPGPPVLSDSIFFLLDLRDSCFQVKLKEAAGPQKGKQPCSLSDNRAGATHQQTWEPPPAKWIKINVDGSFVASTGAAGVGVIARDHKGSVIFTAWRTLNHCPSPFVAEATTCAN